MRCNAARLAVAYFPMERPVGLERACRSGEPPDVGEVIVPRETIQQRLDELAGEIAAAYGLGFGGWGRNLPDIMALREDARDPK